MALFVVCPHCGRDVLHGRKQCDNCPQQFRLHNGIVEDGVFIVGLWYHGVVTQRINLDEDDDYDEPDACQAFFRRLCFCF